MTDLKFFQPTNRKNVDGNKQQVQLKKKNKKESDAPSSDSDCPPEYSDRESNASFEV